MYRFLPFLQFWGLWFLATSFLCFLVALAQIYSREETFDNVRLIDFSVVYSVTANGSGELEKNFKMAADQIALSSGAVLFPMALLTETSCVPNGELGNRRSLCPAFDNLNEWLKKVALKPKPNRYQPYSFFSFEDQSYVNQAIDEKTMLIGLAGDYSSINPYANPRKAFYRSIMDRYLGTEYGRNSMYKKTRWAMLFIVLSSFISTLTFLFLKRLADQRHALKVRGLEAELAKKDGEWTRLQNENGEINLRLREKKDEILAMQSRIQREKESNKSVSEDLLNQAIKLEGEKNGLSDEKEALQIRIIELEEEIESISNQQVQQADGGSRDNLVMELVKARLDYQELVQLWRRKTNWSHRLKIESKVSTESKRVPFTISTAFIAFENFIDQSFERDASKDNEPEPTLLEKINSISRGNPELRDLMHNIRKARNNWFHDGSAPEFGLVKELLHLIEREEPRI